MFWNDITFGKVVSASMVKKKIKVMLCGENIGITTSDIPYYRLFREFVEFVDFESARIILVTHHRQSISEFFRTYTESKIYLFLAAEGVTPDFNLFDYSVGFDPLSFDGRYCQIHPLSFFNLYLMYGDLFCARELPESPQNFFCNFIYSNPSANAYRDMFFHHLNAVKRVDSHGNHLTNIDSGIRRKSWSEPFWREDKIRIQKNYKFSIAIENQAQAGYITEKLITSYVAGTVPLYWGASDVSKYFNEDSFVNLRRFATVDESVDHVLRLDSDNRKYREVFKAPFMLKEHYEHFIEMEEALKAFFYKVFSEETVKNGPIRPVGTHNSLYILSQRKFQALVSFAYIVKQNIKGLWKR
jgi:hypothetical protein